MSWKAAADLPFVFRIGAQCHRWIRICLALLLLCAAAAQGQAVTQSVPELRNEFEFSQTSIHFQTGKDYLGAGLVYRRMVRSWIGAEAEASVYPQMQSQGDDKSYGELIQFVGALLIGHRWRRVSLFGEAGMGATRAHIFVGLNAQYQPTNALRTYKDVIVGGLVDVQVARHFSLTFEGRDNIDLIPTFYEFNVANPTVELVDPASTLHSGEARMGIALRF